jgi:hypothetical protein
MCCADREQAASLPKHYARNHMQPILNHIASVVRPALRKYLEAESALTHAIESTDAVLSSTARQDVMLAARQAADVLHHLADFALKEPSPSLAFAKIEDVRSAVAARCVSFGRPRLLPTLHCCGMLPTRSSTTAQTGRVLRSWFRLMSCP